MHPRRIVVLSSVIALLSGIAIWSLVVTTTGVGATLFGEQTDVARSGPGGLATLSEYVVTPDGTLDPAPQGRSLEIWNDFVRVATPEFVLSNITKYRVGDDSDAFASAYVTGDESDPTKWVFGINLAEDTDRLLPILVHEYAHVLSLGLGNSDPRVTECHTELTDMGCLRPESDLERFFQRFWAGYADAPARDNDDAKAGAAFFDQHEEDFVTPYAATKDAEDFAETFAVWVTEPVGERRGVIAEKFAFLDALPDYARARERIRAEFGLD